MLLKKKIKSGKRKGKGDEARNGDKQKETENKRGKS